MIRPWVKKRVPLASFVGDQQGAAAIEYGLIVGGMALAIIGAVSAIGNELNIIFESIATTVETAERCVEVDSNCKK